MVCIIGPHLIHTLNFLEPFLGAGAKRSRGAITSPPHRPPHTPAPRGPNTVQPRRTPGQPPPPPPPLLPVGQREDSCEIVSSLKILDCSSTQVVALRWPEMDFCNCKITVAWVMKNCSRAPQVLCADTVLSPPSVWGVSRAPARSVSRQPAEPRRATLHEAHRTWYCRDAALFGIHVRIFELYPESAVWDVRVSWKFKT
ncbi:hypothetical protein E2C01_005173 [Portunus trituberculatus]|uniref:Uncharacterized protein n=1 Tax=Portunus trituberculatus TaxID=210409 RepID=A0A5B7CUU2_PORTR|nr:hypothetical protein [Portunus trituberculatus]